MRAISTGLAVLSACLVVNGCGGDGGEGSAALPPSTVPATLGSHAVVGWNDLGMHCVDGKDYSVFSILPPYNNLHAQVVQRTASGNKLVTSGISLTYEATPDAAGSINTSSATKTNFWTWVQKLFGLANPLAADTGLAGNPTPSKAPAPMAFDAANGWWHADGIPITPYDDTGAKNFYPMVSVVARDSAGTVLASSKIVLPVSDEMSCKACHGSTSAYAAARPAAGWINDANPELDWKKNILRLHDERFPGAIASAGKQATYTGGSLLATAQAGQPVLCAACHKSNALGTPQVGTIPPLTSSMHALHAGAPDPVSGAPLDLGATRDSCYLCHPGSITKCLRGVMGNAVDGNGKPIIDCQSCHGNLSNVGTRTREGWFDEPACQNCHDRAAAGAPFSRFTSVFSAGTIVRTAVDNRFATTPNAPMAGKSLYRFSAGHGNLQCEACHGATHAEYPSSHASDNAQSLDLQGHVGTIAECAVCHANPPGNAVDGGPHGMHVVGDSWVQQHRSVGWSAACAVCHGSDARGTFLSKSFSSGQVIGCYTCHNGPNP